MVQKDYSGVAYFFVSVGDKVSATPSLGFSGAYYSSTPFWPTGKYGGSRACGLGFHLTVY